MYRFRLALLPLLLMLSSVGCSPASVAMKVGMFAVGKVVDDAETDKLGQTLLGQPPSAADAQLGPRNDTFTQVDGPVMWISYPVKLDVLKQNQYFVEVNGGRIVRIEKLEGATGDVDLARSTFEKMRVHGKSPGECEQILGVGPPELAVRSQNTGKLMQLYNGRLIADVGDKKYIILYFDQTQRCEKLQIVDVGVDVG